MISVIIPIYNSEQHLAMSLDSLLAQSYRDFEAVLVDDGSTDSSFEIAAGYVSKDKRFKLFHKENGGVSSARNFGLDNASGDYVCFLDSDDELFPDALQILMSGMKDGVDLVLAGYEIFNNECRLVYSVPDRFQKELTPKETAYQMYYPKPYVYEGYLWNKLFKRSIIEYNKIRFDVDIFYNEDRLFAMKYITSQRGKTLLDTTPVYKYYTWSSGAMGVASNSFNDRFLTDFYALQRMKRLVVCRMRDKELCRMADAALFESNAKINNMISSCDSKKRRSIHRKLQFALYSTVSPFLLLKRKFANMIQGE